MSFLAGRTNRATYALYLLLFLVVTSIAAGLNFRIPGEAFLVWIAVPRPHDIGKSGWWIALAFIPEIAAVIGIVTGTMSTEIGLASALVALLVAAILLLCVPGQPGPNRFGERPNPGVGRKRAT